MQIPNKLFPFIYFFLKEYKIPSFIYIFLSIIAGLWAPFNNYLIKNVIDLLTIVNKENINIIFTPVSLIVINFVVFDNLTWRGITYIRARYTPYIINKIIAYMTDYTLHHSHQFFQNKLSGKLLKQISNLAESVEQLITMIGANFLRGASTLFAAFIATYFVHPIFCLILIIWFIVFIAVSILMSQKFVSLADKQAEAESLVIGELVDVISNHSNIRIFARNIYENKRLKPFFNIQQQAYSNTYLFAMILNIVQGGLIAVMMGFSAYYLVKLYSQDLISIGDFALIFGLSMETGHLMWFTMSQIDEYNKASGKIKQSLNSLLEPLEIIDSKNAKKIIKPEGRIKFKNIKFSYNDRELLFNNKSINFKARQKIGVVGYSGSGKTTFVNLIIRFYEATEGEILIDNFNIRDVTLASLRDNIALIPQDPILFQRSLMENIRYGKVDASDEEVINAAKKAHAHEFITQLEYGYKTLVGERGVKLSGGQRQRIAIARAILKDAPILILDEATSQLDSITENLIQKSIKDLMSNKTTIIIAHRLSTLLNMDRILVFDKGKIVGDGTHQMLLKNNKLYKELWDAQIGGFLGDKH